MRSLGRDYHDFDVAEMVRVTSLADHNEIPDSSRCLRTSSRNCTHVHS